MKKVKALMGLVAMVVVSLHMLTGGLYIVEDKKLRIKNHKRTVGAVACVVLVSVILMHQWIVPAIGNYLGDRTIRCFDCTEIGTSVMQSEQAAPSLNASGDGGRSEFSGETIEELLPQIREFSPAICDYCAHLMAGILTLPPDSAEWNEAWVAFHSLRPRSRLLRRH